MKRNIIIAICAIVACRATDASEIRGESLLGEAGVEAMTSEEKAALCPIGGKPMYLHTGDFVCEDPRRSSVKVSVVAAECPVCGQTVKAPVPNNESHHAELLGADADFCKHSIGMSTVYCSVWMCTSCGYAAYWKDFEKEVADEVATFVRENITNVTVQQLRKLVSIEKLLDIAPGSVDLTAVPDPIKYENALVIYRERGTTNSMQARLFLENAHAYRRLVVMPFTSIRMAKSIERANEVLAGVDNDTSDPAAVIARSEEYLQAADLAELEDEESGTLSRNARYLIHLALAGCYDRLGEGWNARREFAKANEMIEPSEEWPEKVVTLQGEILRRMDWMMIEVKNIRQAVNYFRKSLAAGEGNEADKVVAAYLVGELERRLGNLDSAAAWLDAAMLAAVKVDSPLVERIERQRRHDVLRYHLPGADAMLEAFSALSLDIEELPPVAQETGEAGEAGEPGEGENPAVEGPSAPKDCRELMTNIYEAIVRCQQKTGSPPETLDGLIEGHFISSLAANDWMCPETGERLLYRRPESLDRGVYMIYHTHPSESECKLILNADGTFTTYGEHK